MLDEVRELGNAVICVFTESSENIYGTENLFFCPSM
jgi:hypothetical protein